MEPAVDLYDNFIPIVINKEINPIFLKANSYIISKSNDFESVETINNEKKLENLWRKTFGARLIKHNSNTWTYIVFDTVKDKTIFLLKYGI
jgi:hypothetical protein